MEAELQSQPQDDVQLITDPPFMLAEGVRCPICLLPAGRLIRNKIYCGNCGFIES
jgi:hypothetical protein